MVALSVLVALVILYKKRKGSLTFPSESKSRERLDTQHSRHLENPLYSGEYTKSLNYFYSHILTSVLGIQYTR